MSLHSSRYKMCGNHHGVGLLEVLILLAVAIILVAVAVPMVFSTLELYRLESSAALFATRLNEARINAVKRNRDAWVAVDNTGGTFQIQTTSPDGLTLNLTSPEPLPDGVTFSSTTPSQITFGPIGRPTTAGPQNVQMSGAYTGRQKAVQVSPSGKVSVKKDQP